MLVSKPK